MEEKLKERDYKRKVKEYMGMVAARKNIPIEDRQQEKRNYDLMDSVFHKMKIDVNTSTRDMILQPRALEVLYKDVQEIKDDLKIKEQEITEIMHNAFQLYKPDEIFLSFNGGKDCTVVLHMLHTFFQRNHCLKHFRIPTLYITEPDAFEEIEQFVNDCEQIFNIELIRTKGPMEEAVRQICKKNPKLKAVFMGCRKTDPFCKNVKTMQMTDPGWPPLMRINPIIDWNCRQVWEYIYLYDVPYCTLYQKGYTSIGNKKNSKPNPYLRLINFETGKVVDHRPGYELLDNDELERAGRF